jgi:cell fate (sporulation/competence/biofilm development) regulator YmcA (YheA/YmcA/DUF963 family)
VGDAGSYEAKLTRAFRNTISFTVSKKADSLFKCVSAASIVAKVTRDRSVREWEFAEPALRASVKKMSEVLQKSAPFFEHLQRQQAADKKDAGANVVRFFQEVENVVAVAAAADTQATFQQMLKLAAAGGTIKKPAGRSKAPAQKAVRPAAPEPRTQGQGEADAEPDSEPDFEPDAEAVAEPAADDGEDGDEDVALTRFAGHKRPRVDTGAADDAEVDEAGAGLESAPREWISHSRQSLHPYASGSGYPGDPLTKAWLVRNLEPVFGYSNVVRFSWQTIKTILDAAEQAVPVLWPEENEEASALGPGAAKYPPQAKLGSFFAAAPSRISSLGESNSSSSRGVDIADRPAIAFRTRSEFFKKRRLEPVEDL